jgi:Isopenicillin N synthase and related dioxygenases
MSIPVIDLAQALTPSSANIADVVEKLRAAATSSGFFYVKNHGISSADSTSV